MRNTLLFLSILTTASRPLVPFLLPGRVVLPGERGTSSVLRIEG